MKKIRTSKLNAIDAAILLIMVLLVAVSYINTNSKKIEMLNIKEESAYVVLSVSPESASITPNFSSGQNIMLTDSDICVGTIISCEKIYVQSLELDENGNPIKIENKDIFGYELILKTTVKNNDKGYFIDGALFVAPGKQLLVNIEKDNTSFNVEVNSISVK